MNTFMFANEVSKIFQGTDFNADLVVRNNVIAITLGKALSLDLAMPSSCVNSIQGFFHDTHAYHVRDVISAINETYIIDTDMVRETTFTFYKLRYDALYNPETFFDTLPMLALLAPDVTSTMQDTITAMMTQVDKKDVSRLLTRLLYQTVELSQPSPVAVE